MRRQQWQINIWIKPLSWLYNNRHQRCCFVPSACVWCLFSVTTKQMFVGFKAPAPFWGPRCRIFWDRPVEGIRASTCVQASVSTATMEFTQLFSETSCYCGSLEEDLETAAAALPARWILASKVSSTTIVRRLQIVITVLLRTILVGFCCNPFPGNASVLTENKQRRDRRSGSCQRRHNWGFFHSSRGLQGVQEKFRKNS